jgi:hypothetical protein
MTYEEAADAERHYLGGASPASRSLSAFSRMFKVGHEQGWLQHVPPHEAPKQSQEQS